MSRKRKAPKKIPIVDPKFKSVIIPKLVNSIMYDGKRSTAEKILYDALEKIKSKNKEGLLEYLEKSFKKIIIDNKVSKVSIIGVGMVTTPGVTYRMFNALAKKNINII